MDYKAFMIGILIAVVIGVVAKNDALSIELEHERVQHMMTQASLDDLQVFKPYRAVCDVY